MTDLVQRLVGPNVKSASFHDVTLEAGAINVNSDTYGAPLDRIYNTKGLKNIHIEIENTNATNGLIFKIEKSRKEYLVLSSLGDADFDQDILGNTTVEAVVAATGTITLATALAGDTVTINSLVYTAVAGVKANNTQFSIDGTDTVDAADLADSIENDTRVGTLKNVTATSSIGVVTVTSTAIGAAGNAVTLTEDTGGTTIVVSGATFSGGVDNFDIRDIVDVSPETTAIRIRIRRKTASANATLAGIVSAN